MNAVSKQLLLKPAKYHLQKQLLRAIDISRGTQGTTLSNIQMGQLPKMLLCGLIDSEAFHGKSGSNPFHFEQAGLTQITIQVSSTVCPYGDRNISPQYFSEVYLFIMRTGGRDKFSIKTVPDEL